MNIHYFIPTESVKGCFKSQHEGPNNRLNFAKGHVNGSLTHLPGLAKPVAKLQQSLKMNVPGLWFQGSEPLSPLLGSAATVSAQLPSFHASSLV